MLPSWQHKSAKTNHEFLEEIPDEEEVIEKFKCLVKNHDEHVKKDKAINIFLGGTSEKVIRIVNDLIKALENLIIKLDQQEKKNAKFRAENDRLKAMLKVRSGEFTEYQKSASELSDLGIQLTKETSELKSTFNVNELNKDEHFSQSCKKISVLDKLIKKVQDKLNSDYEALIAAGSPDLSEYLKQISDLDVFSKSLQEVLRRLETAFRLKLEFKSADYSIILQEINHLQELINRVKIDIEKLKSASLRIGCRIGGEDSNRYLEEVVILLKIVEKSKVAVDDLKGSIGTDETISKRKISELEILSKRLQFEIKELEMVVASGDNSSLIKRIKELEDSISRLKQELAEKEDSTKSLKLELRGAKIDFRQKLRELEVTKSKVHTLVDEVKLARQEVEGKDQQIVELFKSEKASESVFRQRFQTQVNSIKPLLQGIRTSKDNALNEMKKIRNFLSEEITEISKALIKKNLAEEALKTQLQELREENSELKSNMQLLDKKETSGSDKQDKGRGNYVSRDLINDVETENRNLKVLLKKTSDENERINRRMEDLQNHKEDETANLKQKLEELMTTRDQLKLDLQVEKTTTKETLKAFDKLSSEGNELERKMKNLRDEIETISTSCRDAVEECSVCRNQLEGLRKEAFHQREYETTLKSKMSSLTEELVSTRMELEAANSRNTSLEKDLELIAIRVADLGRENDDLRGGLNKAEIERQKLAEELSKLREENRQNETHLKTRTDELEEMKSQNTGVQLAIYKAENLEAKRMIESLKNQNLVLEKESRQFECQLSKLREENIRLEKAEFDLKKEKVECDLDKLKQELDNLRKGNEKQETKLVKQRSAKESFEIEKIGDEKLKRKGLEIVVQTLKANTVHFRKDDLEIRTESGKAMEGLEVVNAKLNLKEEKFETIEKELVQRKEENESLRIQLEQFKKNIEVFREERNKLRRDNEEIRSISEMQCKINLVLKEKLQDSLKENEKLGITQMKLNNLEPKLGEFYKDYSAIKKSLEIALEEISDLKQEKIELLKKNGVSGKDHALQL
ncbi:interaptin-like [Belonocnema kinseyi]|uniref:interaptin-like n=1 Tax=Belonocnema kinseyi TaxID=2817044 RepID=UPI00143DBAFC|nr:interaptin-like [Belonocnema kinseyi]